MSKLLLNERPILVLPKLAVEIGLNEAMFLQQIHYWVSHKKNLREGYYWVYNSYADWEKQFPFFSKSTIGRALRNLEKWGLVIVGEFNKASFDKTKWYRINYERLKDFEDEDDGVGMTHPITQEGIIEGTILESSSCQKGPTIPESTSKSNTKNTTDINTLVSTNVDDTKVEKSKYKYSDEDMVLSKLLFQYIRNLDAKAKEPNFEYWANAVRLMREVDKRSYEEIKEVIIWCQNDDFWQGNILSTTKLRQQFSKLLIRMNKERGAASGQQSWQQAPRSANQDKVARESKDSGFYW